HVSRLLRRGRRARRCATAAAVDSAADRADRGHRVRARRARHAADITPIAHPRCDRHGHDTQSDVDAQNPRGARLCSSLLVSYGDGGDCQTPSLSDCTEAAQRSFARLNLLYFTYMLACRRMRIAVFLLVATACGTTPDTRPETADYICQAILVPGCGRA